MMGRFSKAVLFEVLLPDFYSSFSPKCKTARSVDRAAIVGRGLGFSRPQLHPLVLPHVSHFKHVPLRTMVKLEHSGHMSPV
jgi:hypothetical protein